MHQTLNTIAGSVPSSGLKLQTGSREQTGNDMWLLNLIPASVTRFLQQGHTSLVSQTAPLTGGHVFKCLPLQGHHVQTTSSAVERLPSMLAP